MSFLYMEDGIVKVTEEGKELPPVKDLYNADKTQSKKFFNDCVKYVFFVYKKNGIYADMFEQYRKQLVVNRHFETRKIDDFETNIRVVGLIKEYLDRQHTKLERFYYQLEKDMENLMERIHNIPYTKKVKGKYQIEDESGEIRTVPVEEEVENYKEKSDAILQADRLVDYMDKLRTKILKENVDKKKRSTQRLFDSIEKR